MSSGMAASCSVPVRALVLWRPGGQVGSIPQVFRRSQLAE